MLYANAMLGVGERACNTPPHAHRSVVEIAHLELGGRHPSAPQTRSGRGILRPPSRKKYSLLGRMEGVFFFFPSPPLAMSGRAGDRGPPGGLRRHRVLGGHRSPSGDRRCDPAGSAGGRHFISAPSPGDRPGAPRRYRAQSSVGQWDNLQFGQGGALAAQHFLPGRPNGRWDPPLRGSQAPLHTPLMVKT